MEKDGANEKGGTIDELQIVAFKVGEEEYGLSVLQVQEIKKMTEITRVPHTPAYVKGVINLRGSVLPVMDLSTRLGFPSKDNTEDTRIIIVSHKEISIGFIVDAVSEVLTITQENIEPTSSVIGGVAAEYIKGIVKLENRLLSLLNLDRIIELGRENQ